MMLVALDLMELLAKNSHKEIAEVCDQIKELLILKNTQYGNSALDPCRIFSTASCVEQILVRIDDKLSRVSRGAGVMATDEDVANDLIGYLVLLKIALKNQKTNNPNSYYTENNDVIFFSDPASRNDGNNNIDLTLDSGMPDYFDLARRGLAD